MTRTLEEQGFVKHDGGPMPNCYAPDDEVDFIRTEGPPVTWNASDMDNDYWSPRITHHRRHISEREQIDMAINEIDETVDYYRSLERNALTEHKQNWADRAQQAETILKLLQERQPS